MPWGGAFTVPAARSSLPVGSAPHPPAACYLQAQEGANMNKQAFRRYLKTMGWNQNQTVRALPG
jgi:hypothetical protein